SNIISFNNQLFSAIPELMDREFETGRVPVSFRELYSEAVQKDPGGKNGGYVRLEFIDDSDIGWKESVLEKLPSVIESFQDMGYRPSDFGIIVRDNREGADVIRRIIGYSNSVNPVLKQKYDYNVISNDSLLLDRSFAVTFLLAVMAVLNDPDDMISKALMIRYYLLATGSDEAESVSLLSDELDETSRKYFPEGYDSFLQEVKLYPLFEMCERITGFFGLDRHPSHALYLNAFQDLTLSFTANRSSGIKSFLDWWESVGYNKSVVLPEYQDAMRVLTIHKAKGLEYRVVILPFISWNLDHVAGKQPVLWVRPSVPQFNTAPIVPVRYRKELENTIFADDYTDEKYSTYIDNINLLYVALTRAKDAIHGFVPASPKASGGIAKVITEAVRYVPELMDCYDSEMNLFEYGVLSPVERKPVPDQGFEAPGYHVSFGMKSLKLRLQGEEYFTAGAETVRERINYGRLMHEVFQEKINYDDTCKAVRKMVAEGTIPEKDAPDLEERINSLIRSPGVAEWFSHENIVLTEQPLLLPSGITRRPDRIIFRDGKITIVDFKFGTEDPSHAAQVNYYRRLMSEMEYTNIEAFLWYVDINKIVKV
ncbi:MAG TPA: 3'-5' exonuclease, partial [Bacteroidales bacterium]|nr:3'-5' exonuclease [Bacteroidales bacterium]